MASVSYEKSYPHVNRRGLALALCLRFGPLTYVGHGCSRTVFRTADGLRVVKLPRYGNAENLREYVRSLRPMPDGSRVVPTELVWFGEVAVLVAHYLLPLNDRGIDSKTDTAYEVWQRANAGDDVARRDETPWGADRRCRCPFDAPGGRRWGEQGVRALGWTLYDGVQAGFSLLDGRLYRYDVGESEDGNRVHYTYLEQAQLARLRAREAAALSEAA